MDKVLVDLEIIFAKMDDVSTVINIRTIQGASLQAPCPKTFVIRYCPTQFTTSSLAPASFVFWNTYLSTHSPSLKALVLTCRLKYYAIFCNIRLYELMLFIRPLDLNHNVIQLDSGHWLSIHIEMLACLFLLVWLLLFNKIMRMRFHLGVRTMVRQDQRSLYSSSAHFSFALVSFFLMSSRQSSWKIQPDHWLRDTVE